MKGEKTTVPRELTVKQILSKQPISMAKSPVFG